MIYFLRSNGLLQFFNSIRHGLNILATIRINFEHLSFRDAIKFPILIYGKHKLVFSNSTIEFNVKKLRYGMVSIGQNFDRLFCDKGGGYIVIDNGKIVFNGKTVISTKTSLIIIGGYLEFGDDSVVGCGTHIQSRKKLIIGNVTRIAQFCVILDTNIHYMRNVETGKVSTREKQTIIGDYTWIGMRSRIMKGSVIPNYTIVAAGSLINKDMTKDAPQYPVIAGTPAKIVASGNIRIFDMKKENQINKFFKENPEAEYFQDDIGI